jgi:hypothetical protein
MRRIADNKIFRSGARRKRAKIIHHSPPKTIVRDGVQYFIFSEDENMPYLDK